MRSKEEIIKILKTMFPGKYPYMYEAVTNMILSDLPSNTNFKHFNYGDSISQALSQPGDRKVTLLPIYSNERYSVEKLRPINCALKFCDEFKFEHKLTTNTKKNYAKIEWSKLTNTETSKAKGLCTSFIQYDEDVFKSSTENLYTLLNSSRYYDAGTSEYATVVNDICYELFNKYISISRAANLLDAVVKPLDKKQIEILRAAITALDPLVDEFCPWCTWMTLLHVSLELLDERSKENV